MRDSTPRSRPLLGLVCDRSGQLGRILTPALGLGLAMAMSLGGSALGNPAPGGDESERALKRILTLEGGATVRSIARQVDGDWQMKRDGRWVVAPWPIQQVRLERDVLKEMRRLASQLGDPPSAAPRCELADWMFRNGLIEEGVAELDPMIEGIEGVAANTTDGEGAGAVARACASATMERHAFRFGVPDPVEGAPDARSAVEPLLHYASRTTPAVRELCAMRLQGYGNDREVRSALALDLVASSAGRRSWSAFALGRLYPGEELPGLLQRAVLDVSDDVRHSAQVALRVAHEPALVGPVLRALETSRSARVRVHAAEALGNMGYAVAVPALITRLAAVEGASTGRVRHSNIFVGRQSAYLQDFDVEVAQAQAVADPQVNVLVEGQVTDVGVVGVTTVQSSVERQTLRKSLEQLTGVNPGRTSEAWADWWDGNPERH